jgi:hypothetical protein
VVANHQRLEILGNKETVNVDNAFTDPEIHCETCVRIDYQPNLTDHVDVAYVTNGTDLSSAKRISFWVTGQGGVTFNVAGTKGNGEDITYGKTTNVALEEEWRRVELDLTQENLVNVTHLFGFVLEAQMNQTFYLKGISYE